MDDLTGTEESVADEEIPDGDDLLDLDENPEEDEGEPEPEDDIAGGGDEISDEDNLSPLEDEDDPAGMEEEICRPENSSPGGDEYDEDEQDEEPYLNPEMSGRAERPMQEEQSMPYDKTDNDANLSVPKVNMLANLINWVARANREIGRDQIPTFLEVYGISGYLSPELKDVIIHLSEITEEDSEASSSTEIWSQSMLLLHGILTGGEAPLHPIMPSWNNDDNNGSEEEIIEVDKAKDKSVKIKFVLPDADGEEKEFCINLTPEADGSKGK